jgi:flavin-dependent dehydrogenase
VQTCPEEEVSGPMPRKEPAEPRTAVAGAGIVGAYLYRLLVNAGHRVHIFDKKNQTRCGLHPCAWGTSRGFNELVQAVGLDPESYILNRVDYLMMDEVRVSADLKTVDKPRLVKDLLRDAAVDYSEPDLTKYDRIIDATGVTRAFLPRIDNDIVLQCSQYRVRIDDERKNAVRLGGIGYAWCFPLSGQTYHIGCGSLVSDPDSVIRDLGWIENPGYNGGMDIICGCQGGIRLTAPVSSQPFMVRDGTRQIWGVGEAIGCVAPLAGDGIVPGMKSARILMEKWNDPQGYAHAVLEEFAWMEKERRVIDRVSRREKLRFKDAWVLKKNSRRMGMRIRARAAVKLVKAL